MLNIQDAVLATNTNLSDNFPKVISKELSYANPKRFTLTSEEYKQERMNVCKVMYAFQSYPEHMFSVINRFEVNILKLNPQHQLMIPDFPERLTWLRDAIKTNADFINFILLSCDDVFINSDVANKPEQNECKSMILEDNFIYSNMDIEKVFNSFVLFSYLDFNNSIL